MISLWGEEFQIPNKDEEIIKKVKSPKKNVESKTVEQIVKSKSLDIADKLPTIYSEVNRILGIYKQNTQIIKTKDDFVKYIDAAISNGIIAIDTETNNSLDPLTCKLMGPCIYTPGQKNAYIPINHTDLDHNRYEWQLTEEDVKEQFSRLDNVTIIMHNGKFDYQVIKCTCDIALHIDWDTMIAARLLDENELAGLKTQYITKIDPSIEKYSIDHLFKVPYEYVDPDVFALYAATDSFMTYKLYLYQKEILEKDEYSKVYKLFKEVEMPISIISGEMELTGISLDIEYSKRLHNKYHQKLDDVNNRIEQEMNQYKDLVYRWRQTEDANYHPTNKAGKPTKSKSEQLKDPIELTSTTQLSIFLYDILKVPVVDKKNPRGTGTDILEILAENNNLCSLLIEQRTILKMLDAFIDTLPTLISPKDGRLHSHFNQLGTGTGRFSCTDPNLQQIPSHNKEIRMMFCGKPGYTLVGSDFSQQEPRLTTAMSGCKEWIEAYNQGKDLYATIGTGAFKNTYWENMEHHEDGSPNVEGKQRRSKCKALLLGRP